MGILGWDLLKILKMPKILCVSCSGFVHVVHIEAESLIND